ncbi:MAG: biosynthetic peptidoglycan transglycosylase, partial [bacterium]
MIRRPIIAGVAAFLVFRALLLLIPPYQTDLLRYPASTTVFDRHGRELRTSLGPGESLCRPVKLADTGHWTSKAIIALEDKRFYDHHGVDKIAICRAILQNLKAGRVVEGASTLSTLVVKLTAPRSRTFWTKIVEARQAGELEDAVGKDEILAQYLNRAPFGGNIRGIEAASRYYFNKPASELSLSESAMLVAIPQRPETFRPDLHLQAAVIRRNRVLMRMK